MNSLKKKERRQPNENFEESFKNNREYSANKMAKGMPGYFWLPSGKGKGGYCLTAISGRRAQKKTFLICRNVFFLRDTPGRQPPCLHERIFAGQRTVSGISHELSAVSRGSDGGREIPYPIAIRRQAADTRYQLLTGGILSCTNGENDGKS